MNTIIEENTVHLIKSYIQYDKYLKILKIIMIFIGDVAVVFCIVLTFNLFRFNSPKLASENIKL